MASQFIAELSLTDKEEELLRMIYNLEQEHHAYEPGWCSDNKENLGKALNISRQWVHMIIRKLIHMELLEKDERTRFIRTTSKYKDLFNAPPNARE